MQVIGLMNKKFCIHTLLLCVVVLVSNSSANAQCASINSFTLAPQPTSGTYAPGTTINVCATVNDYPGLSLGGNPSWFEGFDITLGSGWIASSLTPIGPPPVNAGGGVGSWIWISGTFNVGGSNFGPGYFFDYNNNGASGDDWGDYATVGPWTMCFSVTAGGTPGASLSLNIATVSDGDAGSFTGDGCPGDLGPNTNPITPVGTTISTCLNPPTVSIVNTTDVQCPGQSTGTITFTASGGSGGPYTYLVDGVASGNQATNLSANTYQVSAIDNSGCSSLPVAATVGGPAAFSNSTNITQTLSCLLNAVNFQPGEFEVITTGGTSPYNYTFAGSTNQTGVFSVDAPGTYTVNLIDNNGCASSANVTFPTLPLVPITVNPIVDAACSGAPTGSADVNALGLAGPFTYQLNGVTNSTGLFPSLSSGNYVATVTTASGCTYEAPFTIGEQSNITATVPVVANVSCFGNTSGSISLSVSGGTAPYEVSTNGVSFTNIANNQTVTFSSLPAGSYIVNIEDAIGCSYTTAAINITQPGQALSVAPAAVATICAGSSNGSIQSNISGGTTPYTIAWSNGSNAVNLSNLTAGTYTITVTDANGCTASGSASVVETPLPVASVGPGGEFCQGFDFPLTYTGPGGIGYQYQWSPVTGLNNATSANPIAAPTATTNYTLVITDANNCQSAPSSAVEVVYHPTPAAPVINVSGPLEFCEGNSVTLSVSGGNSYLWSNGSTLNTFTVSGSGTFSVHLTDNFGCVSPESLPVAVIVNPLPAAPQLSSIPASTFCQGTTALLTIESNLTNLEVLWSNGDNDNNDNTVIDQQGVYTATVTDANGCESSSNIAMGIEPLPPQPVILSSSGSTTLCEGESIVLTCSSADSYQWSSADNSITSTANSITVAQTGTYTVTTTTGTCLPMSVSASVTVRPIPEPNIVFDTTLIDCLPSVLSFSSNPTGLGSLAYGWNFGDGNGATTVNAVHEYQKPGLYTVSMMVMDQFGCTGYQTIEGMVKILPRADLNYVVNPKSVSISDAFVELVGLSQNATGDTWEIEQINPGFDTLDILTFDSSYTSHTFLDTGVYLVRYTVTTAEGCVASAEDWVRVYEDFDMFIPMGFSPDGDGINDEFFPVLPGFELDDYEFRIFNRWGRQVFLTYSTTTGWSGADMPAGYYFWKIKGKSKIDQEQFDQDGYLFLLR
jgi:hypothetical protein